MNSLFHQTEAFYKKYERRISSFAFIAGFIFDNLTIQRIDFLFDNLIIISYLIISGGSIILINYYHERPPQRNFFISIQRLLPFFLQFALGALFSAFFVFYTRSATLSSSWLFILILLALLVGNEFFKERYERLTFQVSIYFVAVFSFSIFFVPVLLKSMGASIFLLSGVVSLFFISLFSFVLFEVVPTRYKESQTNLRIAVLTIFTLINILYFTNLIPPIPLAMKDSGVFYSVEKLGDHYLVVGEKKEGNRLLSFFTPEIIRLKTGAPLYLFSSVFAPTDLNTKIVHDWQFFDDATGEWVSAARIIFSIKGGRGEGYRGFSKKENLFPGAWRVDVKTERGQIIGRVRFDIVAPSSETVLEDKVL